MGCLESIIKVMTDDAGLSSLSDLGIRFPTLLCVESRA